MKTSTTIALLFLLTVAVIGLFAGLEPKVAAFILPAVSKTRFEKLASAIEETKSVDAKDFWHFSEFYSPGSYTYNSSGVPALPETQIFTKRLTLHPSLTFLSDNLFTSAGHTHLTSLPKNIATQQDTVLVNTPTTLFLKQPNAQYVLIFITPIATIKKANGFLQHETAADNKAGTYWLSISIIKT